MRKQLTYSLRLCSLAPLVPIPIDLRLRYLHGLQRDHRWCRCLPPVMRVGPLRRVERRRVERREGRGEQGGRQHTGRRGAGGRVGRCAHAGGEVGCEDHRIFLQTTNNREEKVSEWKDSNGGGELTIRLRSRSSLSRSASRPAGLWSCCSVRFRLIPLIITLVGG